MRVNKRRDAKMQDLMKSLNLGGMGNAFGPGGGVQMFNGMGGGGMGGFGSLLSGMGGGGGGGGMGGANMSDAQMRQMAHAIVSGAS